MTSQTRPDPTRAPDLDLGAQFSYPVPRPTATPLRPDLTLTSHWRVLTRRVGHCSYSKGLDSAVGGRAVLGASVHSHSHTKSFSKMASISHRIALVSAVRQRVRHGSSVIHAVISCT